MNSADFARNAVQQAQIARVNAILGLEPEALPVAMSSASKPETQNKRNYRHHHAPPPKSQPVQSQPTSSEASEVSKEQVLKVLEEQMAAIGTVTVEDVEEMEEKDKNSYLREFVAPIVGAVEKNQVSEVINEVLRMDVEYIVQAINDPKFMYEAITKAEKQLGMWFVCLQSFSLQVTMNHHGIAYGSTETFLFRNTCRSGESMGFGEQ